MPRLYDTVFQIWAPIGRLLPWIQKSIIRVWYGFLTSRAFGDQLTLLNLGWAPLDGDASQLELSERDEADRFGIQLYHHLASRIDWRGLDALEVGCGRGGGASWIANHCQPRSLTALDISGRAVDFCKRTHAASGLSFVKGDAEDLPFSDASLDVVLNIESSHGYPDFGRFLREVKRVLKPGGHFLYADFRYAREESAWRQGLQQVGWTMVDEVDLGPHVLKAMELDYERRAQLFDRHIPAVLRPHFRSVIGLSDWSMFYAPIASGEMVYRSFVCVRESKATGLA